MAFLAATAIVQGIEQTARRAHTFAGGQRGLQQDFARRHLRHAARVDSIKANATSDQLQPSQPAHEILKKTSMTVNTSVTCPCNLGFFWHAKHKECVKQGSWGYACGFFPAEQRAHACRDGLKCSPGAEDSSGSMSCVPCVAQDKCATGKTRHSEQCYKEIKVVGQACTTVRVNVTLPANASGAKPSAPRVSKAEASACANPAEAGERLGLRVMPLLNPNLANALVMSGDSKAFELAFAKASKMAKA